MSVVGRPADDTSWTQNVVWKTPLESLTQSFIVEYLFWESRHPVSGRIVCMFHTFSVSAASSSFVDHCCRFDAESWSSRISPVSRISREYGSDITKSELSAREIPCVSWALIKWLLQISLAQILVRSSESRGRSSNVCVDGSSHLISDVWSASWMSFLLCVSFSPSYVADYGGSSSSAGDWTGSWKSLWDNGDTRRWFSVERKGT